MNASSFPTFDDDPCGGAGKAGGTGGTGGTEAFKALLSIMVSSGAPVALVCTALLGNGGGRFTGTFTSTARAGLSAPAGGVSWGCRSEGSANKGIGDEGKEICSPRPIPWDMPHMGQ